MRFTQNINIFAILAELSGLKRCFQGRLVRISRSVHLMSIKSRI